MKLSDFASEMVGGQRFVKAAFAGFAGSGKSRTASEFVIGAYRDLQYTEPVLVIDNEKGARFLRPLFNRASIPAMLKETDSLDDLLTAMQLLARGEISMLFIDSLTKIWYRYIRDYRAKNRKTFMELQDWGKVIPAWQEQFADVFVATAGSIVFTGRGGFEYTKEEDERDEQTGRVKKGSFVKSGVKMKMAGETPFEPDLNIWMEREQAVAPDGAISVWREAMVMKDRSGLIDGKTIQNPTYEHLRPFVRFLCDEPTGAVAGVSSERNIAPGENWDGYTRKTNKTIALEEIQEEIVRMYPGQTKEEKQAKAQLLERLFGTRSWTAVENLSLDRLEAGRNNLWLESRAIPYGQIPGQDPPAELSLVDDSDKIPMDAPAQESAT